MDCKNRKDRRLVYSWYYTIVLFFVSMLVVELAQAQQPKTPDRPSLTKEMPDIIGWNSQGSIIVECKTSLYDFKKDSKKPFRVNPDSGMGKFRYYLFTQELYNEISNRELPAGWGIIVVDTFQRVQQVRLMNSKPWSFNVEAELYYLRNRILEIQRFGH